MTNRKVNLDENSTGKQNTGRNCTVYNCDLSYVFLLIMCRKLLLHLSLLCHNYGEFNVAKTHAITILLNKNIA